MTHAISMEPCLLWHFTDIMLRHLPVFVSQAIEVNAYMLKPPDTHNPVKMVVEKQLAATSTCNYLFDNYCVPKVKCITLW